MIRLLTGYLRLSTRELLLLVILFTCSLPAVTARLYSSDEVEYYSYLRSLWFDHDVSFENEYQYFYDHRIAQSEDFHRTFLELSTPAGRRINYGTLGCAVLWSPFYAVADGGVRVARALGAEVPADGYSRPYVAAVAYGSACYGFAAILLGIAAARRLLGAAAMRAGLAVWAGTPILFYMYIAPPFSHACSAFAVALFVTIWLHVRDAWSPRGAAALGLSGALVAMVREQDALFVLAPALDFLLTAVQAGAGRRARLASHPIATAAAGCLAFAVGYAPQLLAYQALNGRPRPSELVTRKMDWLSPHALQVLASPEHGFLIWTPLAALALAGLVRLALRGEPDRRRIGTFLLLMAALQVYVSGAVASWTVAGAFGQRRFVALTLILVVGLAALGDAARTPVRRTALAVAMAVCVWWNVALMAEFGTRLMDRQRLEPRRNAYDAFVTLPRLAPDLASRYLLRRSSFYQPAAPAAPDPPEEGR
ncbi:MAG: hypothetical protein ABI603_01775 [Acidobacteriota bacterium]